MAVPQMPTKWTERISENIGAMLETTSRTKRENYALLSRHARLKTPFETVIFTHEYCR
jgi:hypothetical protein